MRKKGSRGQNWSLEILIALGVFIVVFVIASLFMFYIPSDPARNIKRQSDTVMDSLEKDVGLIESGEINTFILTQLEFMSCEELRDFFAISGVMCLHFESLNGSVIPVGNKIGVGCDDITFQDGSLCGVSE